MSNDKNAHHQDRHPLVQHPRPSTPATIRSTLDLLSTRLVDHLFPKTKTLAFDVGAGSGRDAVRLASLGFEVIAVEPSAGMRAQVQRLHCSAQTNGSIARWFDT